MQSPWCDTDGGCALHSGPSASFLFFRVSEEELNDYRIWTKSLIASMSISRALIPYSMTSNVPDEDSTSGQVPERGWLWTQLLSTQNEHGALIRRNFCCRTHWGFISLHQHLPPHPNWSTLWLAYLRWLQVSWLKSGLNLSEAEQLVLAWLWQVIQLMWNLLVLTWINSISTLSSGFILSLNTLRVCGSSSQPGLSWGHS